jgi:hypothetical protein
VFDEVTIVLRGNYVNYQHVLRNPDIASFIRLKGKSLFNLAKVDYGTVVWPVNIDIAPETLYDRSIPCESC